MYVCTHVCTVCAYLHTYVLIIHNAKSTQISTVLPLNRACYVCTCLVCVKCAISTQLEALLIRIGWN